MNSFEASWSFILPRCFPNLEGQSLLTCNVLFMRGSALQIRRRISPVIKWFPDLPSIDSPCPPIHTSSGAPVLSRVSLRSDLGACRPCFVLCVLNIQGGARSAPSLQGRWYLSHFFCVVLLKHPLTLQWGENDQAVAAWKFPPRLTTSFLWVSVEKKLLNRVYTGLY